MSDGSVTKPKLTPEALANLVGYFDALICMDKEQILIRKEQEDENVPANPSLVSPKED
jgi:hypothetical protein